MNTILHGRWAWMLVLTLLLLPCLSRGDDQQELTRAQSLIQVELCSDRWDIRDRAQQKLESLFVSGENSSDDVRHRLSSEDFDLPAVVRCIQSTIETTTQEDLRWRLQQLQVRFGTFLVNELDRLRIENLGSGFYPGLFDPVTRFGELALPCLREVAYDREHSHAIRNYAIAVLGELGGQEDCKPLLTITANSSEYNYIRISAAFSTRRLGDERGVDIMLDWFKAMVQQDDKDYASISRLGECYIRAQRWQEAEALYAGYLKIMPYDMQGHFNMAKLLCETDRWEQAMEHLHLSVKNGWRDLNSLRKDPALARLRDQEDFGRLLNIVKVRLEEKNLGSANE